MRITYGKYGGRVIDSPKGKDVRPTSDKLRQAVFNMLQPIINQANFLDLFGGTGAMGIEAESRGGISTIVDSSAQSIALIKQNVRRVGAECNVVRSDATSFVKHCIQKFDIIYIDPPYQSGLDLKCVELIQNNKILADNGIIMVELSSHTDYQPFAEYFDISQVRKYGKSNLIILKNKENSNV